MTNSITGPRRGLGLLVVVGVLSVAFIYQQESLLPKIAYARPVPTNETVAVLRSRTSSLTATLTPAVRHLLTKHTTDDLFASWRFKLDNWTASVPDLPLQNATFSPPHTPGALIHVGKCGGSTVSVQLRNGCHSFVNKPCQTPRNESRISKLSTYYHVPDFNALATAPDYDFYLATMRDPLDRFVSSFLFMHPDNMVARGERFIGNARHYRSFYEPCFPTLDALAEYLDGSDYDYPFEGPSANSSDCGHLARAAVDGNVVAPTHLYFGVRRLFEKLLKNWRRPDKALLLIRQEALWEDWQTANEWLGQASVAVFPEHKVRVTDDLQSAPPVTKSMTEKSRRRLCLALSTEYHVYLEMLIQTVNISPEEKMRMLELGRKNCPELDMQWPGMDGE